MDKSGEVKLPGIDYPVQETEVLITHQGEPLKPLKNQRDALRHAGTLEDNVVPVTPPMYSIAAEEEEPHPHFELTPG